MRAITMPHQNLAINTAGERIGISIYLSFPNEAKGREATVTEIKAIYKGNEVWQIKDLNANTETITEH